MKRWDNDVAVIGGGAAGMFAALIAAQADRSATIIESNQRIGKKLLVTGNGQCNLTNQKIEAENFHGDPEFAMQVISRFSQPQTLRKFRELGLETTVEPDGEIFPRSFQASSVLDVLRFALERLRIPVRTDWTVESIKSIPDGFSIHIRNSEPVYARKVILCCGGKAAPQTGSDGGGYVIASRLGHTIEPLFPALVQLTLTGSLHKAMGGMKWAAKTALISNGKHIRTISGDVLFTSYGVSGSAILKLSRSAVSEMAAGNSVDLSFDLLPELEADETLRMLDARCQSLRDLSMEHFFTGWINKRIGQSLVKSMELPLQIKAGDMNDAQRLALANAIHDWRFHVSGHTGWQMAQVSAGGVSTSEIDPETMQSKILPGLFFAGEIVNIDGDSGGYNLQWAWSSAHAAATAASRELE